MEGYADALLTAFHGGRALWCIQGHHLVGFNHHTILKKEPNCTLVDLLYMDWTIKDAQQESSHS